MMVIGSPVLFLLIVEGALRIAGFGYSTHFFRTAPESQDVLIENPRFGWRFFPRQAARVPDPIRIARQKPAQTYRIFVFGESAALGDPASAYGLSRMLSVLLPERYEGKFEVVNTAMTAINSNVILPLTGECADLQGDCWVFYMGNNEVVGPFGAGSVFGAAAPPRPIIRANLGLRSLRVGQWLESLAANVQKTNATEWAGMEMMLKSEVAFDDPRLQRVYQNFSANLIDAISRGFSSGSKVVVSSMIANLRDCPPFASRHRVSLSESNLAEWNSLYQRGRAALESKKYSDALKQFEGARSLDDAHAELNYNIALTQVALTNHLAAAVAFETARDLDTLRFRCDSELNRRIQSIATNAGPNVHFVNASERLGLSATNIPGTNIFLDHVHFTFHGNYLLARVLAEEIGGALSLKTNSKMFPTEEECAVYLAFTDWDRHQIHSEMLERFRRAPFTNQLGSAAQLRQLETAVADMRRQAIEGLPEAIATYRHALTNRQNDYVLHDRFGAVLEAAGELASAGAEWKRAVELMPQYVDATFKVGTVAARMNQHAEAEAWFRKAIELRPSSIEARNELALALAAQGKTNEATAQFQEVLRIRPGFAEAHVNWGLMLANSGNNSAVREHYDAALVLNPRSAAARMNLGKLLLSQKDLNGAIEQYREAIKIRPGDVAAHLSLASAYQDASRPKDAQAEYVTALQLNPNSALAHLNLGVLLANANNRAEARAHFQSAAENDPTLAEAEFYLGMTYLQDGRLADGEAHLEKALAINPQHAMARAYLDRLRSSQQRRN